MSLLLPPRVTLSWSASALGSAFKAYRVYRRPSRTPVVAWQMIAEYAVGSGQTAATVEAQHTKFIDYEAGWAKSGPSGQWAYGWDYAIVNVNATTNIEAGKGTSLRNVVNTDNNAWITCNTAPYLNQPVAISSASSQDVTDMRAYVALGRDFQLTRSRSELPGQSIDIDWTANGLGEDSQRYARAAAAAGKQLCLLNPTGDRTLGAMRAPSISQEVHGNLVSVASTFMETARESQVSEYNLPAASVLNGSTQFWSIASNSNVDITGAFTIIVCGAFANAGASRYALSKGNIAGAANGYALRTNGVANQLEFFLRGASGNGSLTHTSATYFDGFPHVAALASSGTAQQMYQDGALATVATGAITHGSLTNAIALVMGADNGGASSFMALAGQSVLIYQRQLTAAEVQAASYYLLGYPGYRPPAGASFVVDARDNRCWNGLATTMVDLSGNNAKLLATATPSPRGYPWALKNLDRY